MPKIRSPRIDLVVYLVVRFVVCVLQGLPTPVSRAFAGILARLAFAIDKRHRNVARENLRFAFPEIADDPAKIDRLVRGCYAHFCLMLVEMLMIPRKLHIDNWRNYASLTHGERCTPGLLSGKPFLIVTAHFGNWEMAGFAIGLFGFRTWAIARTLDNPRLEKFLLKFREKTGQTILAKKGDFDEITGVLAQGGTIATLGDQDAGQKGLFVNFFNRPASTHKAVALLALQYDMPMVVVGVPRVGHPAKYEIVAEDLIDPREYEGNPNAVRLMTERYTQALERMIRRHPEQYFWLHRRWKHQPLARNAKRAA